MGLLKHISHWIKPTRKPKDPEVAARNNVKFEELNRLALIDDSISSSFFGDFSHRFCCAGSSRNDIASMLSYFLRYHSGKKAIISSSESLKHVTESLQQQVVTFADYTNHNLSFWKSIKLAFSDPDNELHDLSIKTVRLVINWLCDDFDPESSKLAYEQVKEKLELQPVTFKELLDSLQVEINNEVSLQVIDNFMHNDGSIIEEGDVTFLVDDVPSDHMHYYILLSSLASCSALKDERTSGLLVLDENAHYPIRAKRSLTPFISSGIIQYQKSILVLREKIVDDIYDEDPIFSACSHYLAFNGGVNMSSYRLKEMFSEVYPVVPHGDPGYFNVAAVDFKNHFSAMIEVPR